MTPYGLDPSAEKDLASASITGRDTLPMVVAFGLMTSSLNDCRMKARKMNTAERIRLEEARRQGALEKMGALPE